MYLYHVTSGPEDDFIMSATIDGAATTQRSIEGFVVEYATPCGLVEVSDDSVLDAVVQLDAPGDRLHRRFI